jgi:hypothetical protein
VHRWIRDRFRTRGWPEDWPELTAWDRFPLDNPTVKKLQPWCDRFLDATQWKQVQAVIRAARRDRSQYRTVRLSRKAHHILQEISQRETLTLSEVIEQYLSGVAQTPEAAPAEQRTLPPSPPPATALAPETPHVPAAITDTPSQEAPGAPPPRVMKVALYLRVENNSKFVRGKKKAREEIEQYVLSYYQMEKPEKDGWEYVLSIPYQTDEELETIIARDILQAAALHADVRHCFIEADVVSLDDPDRSW